MTTRVTVKGTVTLPGKVLRQQKVRAGDRLESIADADEPGVITLRRVDAGPKDDLLEALLSCPVKGFMPRLKRRKEPVRKARVVLTACFCLWVSWGSAAARSGGADSPIKITYSELMANPAKWNNTKVDLEGYYCARGEYSSLRQNEADARGRIEHGISVGVCRPDAKQTGFSWTNSGWIRLVGTFMAGTNGHYGHFGLWRAQITDLEKVQGGQPPP